MVNRDSAYITRIEKNYDIDSEDGARKLSMNQVNMMFFVVKDYKNVHQSIEELNKRVFMRTRHT